MGYVRILGTDITLSVDITFAWIIHLRPGVEIRSEVGPILSVVSVVASGIGRGLVVKSGDWSAGRTGVGRGERDLSVDASGIQRGYSGGWSGIDTLFNQSGLFLYPIIPDQAIKIGRHWAGVGRLSGVNVALITVIADRTPSKYDQPTLYRRPPLCTPAQHTTCGKRDHPQLFFNRLKNLSRSPWPLIGVPTNPRCI